MKNLIRPSRASLPFLSLASLLLAAAPVQAAVTFHNSFTGTVSEISSTSELAYQGNVSSTDLLAGKVPVTAGWNTANGANPIEISDGIHGATFAAAGNLVDGGWTFAGATATYDLGLGIGYGYDITSIQSIAAWVDARFGNQAWTIAVSIRGSGFFDLATIDYQPLAAGGATQVSLTGLTATGIDAIRFTANSINSPGNAFVSREIDVFGTPSIPEPGTALLGIAGMVLLLGRRRMIAAR